MQVIGPCFVSGKQIDAIPTASGIEVWHAVKEIVESLAADDYRLFACSMRLHIALREETGIIAHIYRSTGLDGQFAVDDERVTNEIGQGAVKGIVINKHPSFGSYPPHVLSICLQQDFLCSAGRQLKTEPVTHQQRVGIVCRVYLHAYKNKQTVTTVNLYMVETVSLGFAIHIDAESGLICKDYTVHHDGIGIAVIDHESCRGTTLCSENRVKTQGVA